MIWFTEFSYIYFMNDRFGYIASTLSTEELKARIENRPDYLPETTEASVAELQNRGVEFSEEEIAIINADLQAQRANALLPARGQGINNSAYKKNIVKDPAAPNLYSRRAIYLFTLFFSAFFGSVMFAMNAAKVKNNKGIWIALLFGLAFTTVQLYVGERIKAGSAYPIVCGFVAAACIDFGFWDRFIGRETFYRARNIWGPVAVGLLFIALIVAALFLGNAALDVNVE